MRLDFTKMNGAGNDFLVVLCTPGSTAEKFLSSPTLETEISRVCDRRRGVGADGFIFLTPLPEPCHFRMNFFNNDGSGASMCGNGLRCAGLFASEHGGGTEPVFETDGGTLTAEVLSAAVPPAAPGLVRISIQVNEPFRALGELNGFPSVYVGTAGVPHAIVPVENVDDIDIVAAGRALRYHPAFPDGTNVDFVELSGDIHRIRTYERGVEDETPACGTGITSAGIVLHDFVKKSKKVRFLSRSGAVLDVDISQDGNILKGETVFLTGPAEATFSGSVIIPDQK